MENSEPGILINGKLIGFITSLFVITGLVFSAFSAVNGFSYRIERIEQDNKVLATDITKVSDKLASLNDQLASLTITLTKVEERLNARLEKNK